MEPDRSGPMTKYEEPLRDYFQFRVTQTQQDWLESQRSPHRSKADVVRDLIDEAILKEKKDGG